MEEFLFSVLYLRECGFEVYRQVGNAKLALDTIMNWIMETNRKNSEIAGNPRF